MTYKIAEPVLAELLDSVPGGILAVDSANRILFLNRDFASCFGITAQQWIQRPLAQLAGHIEHEFPSANVQGFHDWPAEPHARHSRELTLTMANNKTVFVREDSAPVLDTGGAVVGRVFAYHDISREKAIDQRKSEFIGMASHELRTPMTSIKGAIDLVLSGFAGEANPEVRELLQIGQKNCERLIRLVNEILDIAKIEAGQIKLNLEPTDPFIPVDDAVRAVRSFANQHGVKLTIDHPETLPSAILDKDRIQQVVINLLSNAIKFSPQNGEVRVCIRCDGPWWECSVIDQGCGIAEADLARVFEKFQQVGDSPRMGGTGLGLAIARGLVGEHSGRISVESQVGRGSCFSFRVPLAGPDRKAESAQSAASTS
jgi:signal transduction histidine kinase